MFTLDRSAFKVNTFAEADSNATYWRTQSPADRLRALEFLNRQAWNIDPNAELILDRSTSTVRIRNMNNVFNADFREFIQALNEAEVDYILVGGYAVVLHGYSRTTGDIDLWIKPTAENYHRLVKAFGKFQMPLFDMTESKFLATTDYDVFSFGVPPVAIDLMTSVKGLEFDPAYTNSSVYEFEDLSLRLVQYHDLLKAKRAAGRLKDLNDVEQLTKGREEE